MVGTNAKSFAASEECGVTTDRVVISALMIGLWSVLYTSVGPSARAYCELIGCARETRAIATD